MNVDVSPARPEDAHVLANLLQLYLYDFSELLDFDVDARGRFAEPDLSVYVEDSPHRAFLVRVEGELAGFALVRRGSQIDADPDVFDVAEFFVMRRYRRMGVGRTMAFAVFDRLPGSFEVRVLDSNAAALGFWRDVVETYTGECFQRSGHSDPPRSWTVYRFATGR